MQTAKGGSWITALNGIQPAQDSRDRVHNHCSRVVGFRTQILTVESLHERNTRTSPPMPSPRFSTLGGSFVSTKRTLLSAHRDPVPVDANRLWGSTGFRVSIHPRRQHKRLQ